MDGRLPKGGQLTAFHHVKFWVGNAKQAAQWYCIHYGFRPYAFRQRELVVSHAVKLDNIILVFETHLKDHDIDFSFHLKTEGDSVRDVAFEVDDIDTTLEMARSKGAEVLRDIWEEEDENGKVRLAVIKAYGNVTHTLIENANFNGLFLPDYKPAEWNIAILDLLPPTNLISIDHVVGAQRLYEMESTVQWYEKTLALHRFWSVDDKSVHTEYTGLRVSVVTNDSGTVKIPIVEPAVGSKRAKSQIQEYLDYNGGPGVQHMAFSTNDIITSVGAMISRGAEFIRAPKTYYTQLRQRLKTAPIDVSENLDEIERLNILLDYDENGYLLQIFTRPVQDRPTLFLEIIQRHNHSGFGAGNIKALFEAVEIEQRQRGNLIDARSDGHA